MGCMPSKNAQTRIAPPRAKVAPQASNTQLTSAKAQILDSIKRADPILFEKTMHTYEVSPTEIIGQSEQMRTILHYIAEVNFAEGMELAMEYILQHLTEHVSEALNVKDAEGNTPVMLCCVYDSVETLEVLMKSEHVDISIKNHADQDAYAIAYQNSSPCLNILSSSPQTQTRETTRSHLAISQVSQVSAVPKLKTPGLENLSSLNGPRHSVRLKSVQSARNESKITPDTRLYKILSQLESTTDNFIDEEFPHDNESIIAEELQSQYLKGYGTVKWLRPHQFLNCDIDAISLFEGIDLNHVSETPLAGCELYSALAAMVEFPQRLLKVFTGKESNKHGAYSVKLLVSGINIEILLDDYFPCLKDSKPLFSRPNATELWFSLLEKAFAKLYGNYNELGNIQAADALQMMTGMPSSQQSLKEVDVDELWNQLLEYDKRNYIFCAGNNKAANEKKNRVFSVVRLCEAGNYHIVKLKNHFGDFSWKGDFSDGSQLWTQELKDEVGHYDGEKNYFYMDIKEFVKQLDFVSVCYYNDNLIKSSEEVTCNHKKPVFFEIEVDRQMEVFISVHQKHPRFVDEPGYEISPVEILVAELHEDDDALRKIASGEKDAFAGKQTVFADDKGKIKLSEGKYIIRVKIRWVDEEKHEFTLNAFSPYNLSLKKVKARKYQDFLERVYLDAGSRSGERYQLGNRCEFGSSWCGSHLWLYGTNKGNKTWNLEIVFNKVENLRLCKKYKTSESVVRMVIPPNGQAVAFAKRINSKTVELNWNFNQSWS